MHAGSITEVCMTKPCNAHLKIQLHGAQLPLLALQPCLPFLQCTLPLFNLPAGFALDAGLPCLQLPFLLCQLLPSLLPTAEFML